jgi:hypothetical protein
LFDVAPPLVMSQLRLATALAHTVPGVTLELVGRPGDVITVAYDRLDAALNPCHLRAGVLAESWVYRRLLDTISSVRVGRGLEHLGGGLYRRFGVTSDERWFATWLDHESSSAVFDRCELDVPPETMNVTLRPDPALGVTAVRIAANDPALGFRLDEVGFWALAACMAEETIHACVGIASRQTKKP